MNLLITSTAYPPSTGGAQLHMHMLATHLHKSHKVNVISFWDHNRTDWLLGTTILAPGKEADYLINQIPVHTLGFNLAQKIAFIPYLATYYPLMGYASKKIAAFIESEMGSFTQKADIIHNIRIGREPFSIASYHCAKKQGIPFFLTPVHHPRWKGWRYEVYNELYRQADGLIALTKSEKKYLQELGVKEEKIFVTGNGPILANTADASSFIEQNKIDGPIILFLGQHYIYKGFAQLLQSASIVWKKFPEAHFVFIGPDVNHSEKFFQGQSDHRIHRLGAVDLQTKTNALAACTLLCVPSTQESFGGVYTEAWAFNKPVIGCPIPAVSEVISDGVDGYLAEQTPEAIAERIVDLLQYPSRAADMGRAGCQKVDQKYSWNRVAQLTEDAYQAVLARG